MARLLAWLILGVIGALFVRSFLQGLAGGAAGRPRGGPAGARGADGGAAERLVRDRVCDTYLPRSRAIREVDAAGVEHFFCSEACRERHREAVS